MAKDKKGTICEKKVKEEGNPALQQTTWVGCQAGSKMALRFPFPAAGYPVHGRSKQNSDGCRFLLNSKVEVPSTNEPE